MKRIAFTILTLVIMLAPGTPVAAQTDVVRAVLFYSPTCPHCQLVITTYMPQISQQFNSSVTWDFYGEDYDPTSEDTPPLVALLGNALQVLYVDTASELGNALYAAAIERYSIPQENWVVPLLVIEDTILTGSVDIPEQLPLIAEQALGSGGIDWPDIPGLAAYIEALQPFPGQEVPEAPTPTEATGATSAAPTQEPAALPGALDRNPAELPLGERIMLDPAGNSIAIVVLVGMLLSVLAVGLRWSGRFAPRRPEPVSIWIPPLAIAGIVVAGYLAYIAVSGNDAACGPVGDCNTVARSEYSGLLLGIPNGFLGVAGYAVILIGWLTARYAQPAAARPAVLGVFAASVLGTLFSLYLTFLEPFVLGASCAWCLTSAILITAIMLLSVSPARARYRPEDPDGQKMNVPLLHQG
jgi:uncharacterized membrane protein